VNEGDIGKELREPQRSRFRISPDNHRIVRHRSLIDIDHCSTSIIDRSVTDFADRPSYPRDMNGFFRSGRAREVRMTLHWLRSTALSLSWPPSADCGSSSSALFTRSHSDRDNRSFADSAFLRRSFRNVFISSLQKAGLPPRPSREVTHEMAIGRHPSVANVAFCPLGIFVPFSTRPVS
jgi:hypothetical protein